MSIDNRQENLFSDLEKRLGNLTTPMPKAQPGDWLASHSEKGQTFRQYLSANPIRRDRELNTIYLCLLGDFTEPHERILDLTREYISLFFDVPVEVHRCVPLSDIPATARRKHPRWGDKQLLTTFILRELLEPNCPDHALAYLALADRRKQRAHSARGLGRFRETFGQ